MPIKRCQKVDVLKNLRGTVFCTISRVQTSSDGNTADLLAPVPAVQGALVGYARVSTQGQLLDRQVHALTEAGCIRIFADKKSGKNAKREELRKASTTSARATPSSSPHSTGSAAPSTTSSRSSPACASAASASPRSTRRSTPPPRADAWSSTSSPHSRSSSANSSSRAPTKAWTQPARGARLGRPPAMTEEQIRHARDLLTRPENTVTSIAKLLGVSRNTIYKYVPVYVPELKGDRATLGEPDSTPALPRPAQSAE